MHCAVNYQVCSFFKSSFGVIKSRGNNSLPNKKEIAHYCSDFSLSCLYDKDIYENFCVDTNLLNIYVFYNLLEAFYYSSLMQYHNFQLN